MEMSEHPFLRLLREERFYILFGLLALIALSWAYLVFWDMPMGAGGFTLPYFLTLFTMWAVMMVAMMVPSALPMILLYSHSVRKARTEGGNLAPLSVFVGGYVAVWTLFSAGAAFLQLTLQEFGVITPMMVGTHPWLIGGLLIVAGVYQMSPQKEVCLRFCQHPVLFITKHWRTGTWGAFQMGLRHGSFCVGCCWALMALLFVGGVMNLLWVALIAIYVLVEKILPLPQRWGQISGAVLIAGGLGFGFQAF